MTIKQKLIIVTVIFITTLVSLSLTVFFGYRHVTTEASLGNDFDNETMYLQTMIRGLNEAIINKGSPASLRTENEGIDGFDKIHTRLLAEMKDPEIRMILIKEIHPLWKVIKKEIKPFQYQYHYIDIDDDELMMKTGRLIMKAEIIIKHVKELSKKKHAIVDGNSRQSATIEKIMLLVIFVLLSCSAFLTRHAYYSISKPISELIEAAQIIGSGNMKYRVENVSKDEIGVLSTSFNKMADDLEKVIAHRDEEIRERIETQVMLIDSESRFRSVIESANDAIISINSSGEIIFWNNSAEEIFGYSEKEVIGKPVTMCIPERLRNAHLKGMDCLSDTGEQKIIGNTVELTGLKKDGSEFPLELSFGMWTAENQTNYTGMVRDIAERKNAEIALEKSQSTIIQQEKMASIGQLAGGIAHDFNNILSVITGYSELALKDMEKDSPFKEHLSTIHAAGEKAASLTKELLAFSRKQPLKMMASNINTTIDNMKNILKRLIGENIRLKIIKHKDLNNILGDKTQLEQVLMNLVVNARDAMASGGDLTIKTLNVDFKKGFNMGNEHIEPGQYTMLSVRDTGTGINKDVMEKIFEPFFSTKDVGKGTGMGLSTVYGVVKQHGGHITVKSKSGEGTVFKIYVPSTDKEIEEDTEINATNLTGNETILVVDDEPLLINLLAEMLGPLGYHVLTASSGEDALKVCNDFKGWIDLLLTDVMMPMMNGRELAEKFALKRHETKVIYMSGYTDDAIARHGVLEDSVVLINKPVKSSVVAGKIREVMGMKLHQSDNNAADEKLNGINILLADDNASIRKLIQVYMKDYECTVDTAENGEIAVEKFKLDKYDLVLMDMHMPVMNGLTATKEIRKWEEETGISKTMIIALTGSATKEEIDKCLHAGCSSHLAKPIKRDALVNSLALNITTVEKDVCINQEFQEERFVAHVDTELKDLIPEYLVEIHSDINRIQEAIRAQDYETVRIVGHTLKGSGGGYGFDPITEMGIQIEDAAKEEDHEDIEKWNNKLYDYIENVEIIYG